MNTRLLALLLSLALAGCQATATSLSREASSPVIEAVSRVEEYVRHLAADAMRGRDTGTRESLEAAEYIGRSFRAAGLQPAGDDDTYLQDIGQRGWTLTAMEVALLDADGQATELTHGADYVLIGGGPVEGTWPIVAVAGADEVGGEASWADRALLLDASARGLSGRELLGANFGLMRSLRQAPPPGLSLVLVASRPTRGEPRPVPARLVGSPGSPTCFWLRGDALAAVRDGTATAVRVRVAGEDAVPAVNVVGLLPGVGTPERPELADEAIVFSAHYDHIGVLPPGREAGEDGDRVFNGADDDASGVATVMALAEAFGRSTPPARTLVFLAVTGEEKGLLGTYHYLEQPVVPLERTVCNLNFEMVGMPDAMAGGAGSLFLTGYERTNLGPVWSESGLPIVADPRPERNYFRRSDNYPFAVLGIVAQTLSSGGENPHYHELSDEADTLDYEHMRTVVEACYRAARPLAEGRVDPEWAPDGKP